VDEIDGDLAVAFEGYEWHTHGDLLVGTYGATEARWRRSMDSDKSTCGWCKEGGKHFVVQSFRAVPPNKRLERTRDE
jgi:hypothetical protein